MSVQSIPNSEKQVIQSNEGDYKGNLHATFNIDLDSNPGTIKTSKRLTRVVDSTLWGTDDIIQALQIHDARYYIATSQGVFSCSVDDDPTVEGNWTATSTLGLEDLGLETDLTSFAGLLLISLGVDIMSWNGSTKNNDWWTTVAGGTALTGSKTHILEVLRTGADTLFITDGNKVRYYNTAAAGTIITLDPFMTADCFTPGLDKMWVGTLTEVENTAYVYEIQVGNTVPSQAYGVDGRVCLSMFTYKNTPFVITERGYIQAFNGAGFETVAQFPWAGQSKVMEGCRPGLVQDSPTSRAIHPKGVQVVGKYAFIFVNADDEYSTNNLSPRGASGVWVLNLETYSLTHRFSLTNATTDVGVHKIDRSGPILITNTPETRLMVGGSISGTEGVWMEDGETPTGYYVTVRHEADSIADAYEAAVTKVDTLETGESVTVKYKDTVVPNFPLLLDDITWLNANQFTVVDTLTDVEVGHEVEITAGFYAGSLCTITAIEGGGTKTVTVDTSFGVLNSLSDIQIDNWKIISEPHTNADGEYKKVGDGNTAMFRQHKVILTGNVTNRQFISKSNPKVGL